MWNAGKEYTYYMGRWSERIASSFLKWINPPSHQIWLDIGCGTGALSQAILLQTNPALVEAIDTSAAYLQEATCRISDSRIHFQLADAQHLPFPNSTFNWVVSGLVFNFLHDTYGTLQEIKRVLKSDGRLGIYVWDYAGKMEMIRFFWDAVKTLFPDDAHLDEGVRYGDAYPSRLRQILEQAGYTEISTTAIEISMHFVDFEAYWRPFLGGQGPAPAYLRSLHTDQSHRLKQYLQNTLPLQADGSIDLIARAWAIQARGE